MNDPNTPSLALAATLHDPDARLLAALLERAVHLAHYSSVQVCATDATDARVLAELRQRGVTVLGGADDRIGEARRQVVRSALDAGADAILYCDFDRWLHWAGNYPDELAAVPRRLARRRPALWYACLGRTARAFATHPEVQRLAEHATNRALAALLGRRIDATAGACWLSCEGAELILACSTAPSNATDLEWPMLVHRADPRRLGYLATEGLEFETAEFYADELTSPATRAAWYRARYETAEAWRTRLQLASDSIDAALRVCAAH